MSRNRTSPDPSFGTMRVEINRNPKAAEGEDSWIVQWQAPHSSATLTEGPMSLEAAQALKIKLRPGSKGKKY